MYDCVQLLDSSTQAARDENIYEFPLNLNWEISLPNIYTFSTEKQLQIEKMLSSRPG